jgi:hypothetical protein
MCISALRFGIENHGKEQVAGEPKMTAVFPRRAFCLEWNVERSPRMTDVPVTILRRQWDRRLGVRKTQGRDLSPPAGTGSGTHSLNFLGNCDRPALKNFRVISHTAPESYCVRIVPIVRESPSRFAFLFETVATSSSSCSHGCSPVTDRRNNSKCYHWRRTG